MVHILQFPGSGKTSDGNVASVADVHSLFADDAAMMFASDSALPVLQFRAPVSEGLDFPEGIHGDWTNQELADLYRVEALLVQAGVRLDTARGVTDENDPWFVFCRPDGDIFVHLARIDGQYLLDSPGMGAPVYGDDFTSLIDIFVRQQVEKAPTGNVVRFRPGAGRDGTVRLHPAMMLAALIWTLYIASDAITGTAEAAENNAHSHGGAHDGGAGAVWHHAVHTSAQVQAAPDNSGQLAIASATSINRDELLAKTASSDARGGHTTYNPASTGHASGSIAASLAAIAVSWGLYDPRNTIASEPANVSPTTVPQPAPHTEQQAETAATTVRETQDVASTHHARDEKHPATSVQVEQKVQPHVLTPVAVDEKHSAPVVAMDTMHDAPVAVAAAPVAPVLDYAVVDNAAQADSAVLREKPADAAEIQALLKLASFYLGDSVTYKVGGVNVAATFDVASLGENATELVFSGITPTEPSVTTPVNPVITTGTGTSGSTTETATKSAYIPSYVTAYDQAAKDFVYKFLMQSVSVEMIKVANSIIFVDTTAIDEPTDVAYVRSWALDDHTTISTIGHAQDFLIYDLA